MLIGLLLMTALTPSASAVPLRATAAERVDSVRQFPRVEGSNLEGKRFALPTDFGAEYNVVVVAFRREQQADVDSWLPFLRQQNVAARGVRVCELPTLSRSYRWMRGVIDGALAIATEDRIVTLIIARDGRVLWRADGRFSTASGTELFAMLDSLGVRAA